MALAVAALNRSSKKPKRGAACIGWPGVGAEEACELVIERGGLVADADFGDMKLHGAGLGEAEVSSAIFGVVQVGLVEPEDGRLVGAGAFHALVEGWEF